MTADVKLLPMPKPGREADFVYGYDRVDMQSYARACVAHSTAAKDAEIEALLAEVDRLQKIVRPKREEECLTLDHWRMRAYDLEANWSRCSRACAGEQDKREQAEAYAERLAEACQWVLDNPGAHRNGVKAVILAALNPAAAQKNDDA